MAAERRSAYVRRLELRGLDQVPREVPPWCQLAPCEPLECPIGGQLVRVTWADVARHAAPAAPVAGVVVMSSAHASAMHSRPVGIRPHRLRVWNPSAVLMQEGDSLEL